MPIDQSIPSHLGRLLSELSWSGSAIRDYRQGGRGFENVLTAEVLQALDFLPRARFLGEVLNVAVGAEVARARLRAEIENAKFTLLPGAAFALCPSQREWSKQLSVQPDAVLEAPSVFGLVECKRLRRSSFQKEQLAREYVLSLLRCGDKAPLLLLILGTPPPVRVIGHGPIDPTEAIRIHLDSVLVRAEDAERLKYSASDQVQDVVCWVTWARIAEVVVERLAALEVPDQSQQACFERLVGAITASLTWHAK